MVKDYEKEDVNVCCEFTKEFYPIKETKNRMYRLYHFEGCNWFKKDLSPTLYSKLLTLLSNPSLTLISIKEKEKLVNKVKQNKKPLNKHSKKEVDKLKSIYISLGYKPLTAERYTYQVLNGILCAPGSKEDITKRKKQDDRREIVNKYLSLGYSFSSANTYSYYVKQGKMPDPRTISNLVKRKVNKPEKKEVIKEIKLKKENKYNIELIKQPDRKKEFKEIYNEFISKGLTDSSAYTYTLQVLKKKKADPRFPIPIVLKKSWTRNGQTNQFKEEHKQHLNQLSKDNQYMKKINQERKKVNKCVFCGKDTLNELCATCEKNQQKKEA